MALCGMFQNHMNVLGSVLPIQTFAGYVYVIHFFVVCL